MAKTVNKAWRASDRKDSKIFSDASIKIKNRVAENGSSEETQAMNKLFNACSVLWPERFSGTPPYTFGTHE